jgi:Protein of unknown function (DUF3455)
MRSLPGRFVIFVAAAAVTVLSAVVPAHAAPVPPAVPGDIAVPAGHKPFLLAHAAGVQIYVCQTHETGYAWGPATPRAVLHDDRGHQIGTHFGGPAWRVDDGSTVLGSRVAGETVDATAIQWLLIKAESATAGTRGDRLAHTTYIQRINTVGGLAPPAPDCNEDTVWTHTEVPYTADYLFWKERA